MLERTHFRKPPWWVCRRSIKKRARLNCIHHLLQQFDYARFRSPPRVARSGNGTSTLPPGSAAQMLVRRSTSILRSMLERSRSGFR